MILRFLISLVIIGQFLASAAAIDVEDHMCSEETKMPNGQIVRSPKCCSGYVKIGKHCQPYCENCQNGRCIRPNECECLVGYFWNQTTKACQQVCHCENGFCPHQNQCVCNKGYRKPRPTSYYCEPICDDPECPPYSVCSGPQQCVCFKGFEMNPETGECELICDDDELFRPDYEAQKCVLKHCSCTNTGGGYCLHNYDECYCYEGFRKTNKSHCEPLCREKCENADCVGSNECRCWHGYHESTDPHVCEEDSMCRGKPCHNGVCQLNGNCKCKSGFNKSLNIKGQIICDTTSMFIAKIMTLVLSIPLILAASVFLYVYMEARKKRIINMPTVQYGEDDDGYAYAYNN